MRRRDLSGFERPPAQSREAGQTAGRPMSRITLSLPSAIAEQLRFISIKRAVGYRALIVDAVERVGSQVHGVHAVPPGRTQVPLNLPAEDLAMIDQAAHRAGVNRSAFVTECLKRDLGLRPPT